MKNANEIIVDFDSISQDRKKINEEAEKLYNIDYDGWISSCTRNSLLWGDCSGNSDFSHSFHYLGTPEIYKVYIYNKDTGEEKITDIIERIDYNSQISIDYETMEVINNISGFSRMSLKILPIIIPMIVTICVELFILFCSGLISKNSSRIVLITNIVSNFILQIILISMDKIKGLTGTFEINCFVLLEVIIILAETYIYLKLLKDIDNKKKIIEYAILANFVSACLTFYEWIVILPILFK